MSAPDCSGESFHSPISTGSVYAMTTLSHESNSISRPISHGAFARSDHAPLPSSVSPTQNELTGAPAIALADISGGLFPVSWSPALSPPQRRFFVYRLSPHRLQNGVA